MTARRLRAGALAIPMLAALGVAGSAFGQDATPQELIDKLTAASSDLRIGIDTVWVLVTAMLVFWMNAGFALVESGLCRAKNSTNILAKNFIVFAISTISFWALGWGLMFGDGNAASWASQGLFFVGGADNSPALGEAYAAMNPFSTTVYEGVYSSINWTPVPLWAKFFFQLVFAGTAATIVSGAVAERIKFGSFVVVQLHPGGVDVPDHRPLDLGRRPGSAPTTSATSPARRWSTRSAAGRRWPASWCWARASASTARTAG